MESMCLHHFPNGQFPNGQFPNGQFPNGKPPMRHVRRAADGSPHWPPSPSW